MPLRVMVVDDEANVRANLAAFLQDEGMDVAVAASGEEAIRMIDHAEFRPQVCVMDMRLPGLDGNETILTLHGLHPDIKFLIHTGSAGYSLRDDLHKAGVPAEAVFHKPLPDMGVLADAIRAAAGQN